MDITPVGALENLEFGCNTVNDVSYGDLNEILPDTDNYYENSNDDF